MKTGMIEKIVFFLFIGLIIHSNLNAQAVSFSDLENKKILYPSPTAASLGKYGEYPVSLYNGLVQIEQEIVTIKSGKLEVNVSLSYHSSGSRPNDIPGWVGMGFSLDAGGVITRTIRDLPDDFPKGYYTDNTSGQYLWNNLLTHFFENYNDGTLDPRSDIYQFNFCGKTGEFIFDWDRNIHFKQQVPFKIEELNAPGGFAGFKITTEDGTIYTFDQKERSNFNFNELDPPVSAWYLTKIENLSGDIISFKYTAPASKFRYKQYRTRKEVVATYSNPNYFVFTDPTITLNFSADEVIYLEEIDFNNGKLLFGTTTRTDPYFIPSGITASSAEEEKLDLITLIDNNDKMVKTWKFEYYENNTERLKLKNLIVQSSEHEEIQKYSFEYNLLKMPLPPPGIPHQNPYLSNSVDYWGYYNAGLNGENGIPKMYMSDIGQSVGSANRSVNPSVVKAEILEKITYPTGGYTIFNYESNDYSAQGASYAAAQNPMYESSTPPEYYELNYFRDEGGFDKDPATFSINLTEPTHVLLSIIFRADGDRHVWAPLGPYNEYEFQLPAGPHTFKGLFQTDELSMEVNADITEAHCYATVYKEGPLVPIYAKTGPGLRIKSIVTNDGTSTTTRSFEYKLADTQEPSISSGYLSVFPAFYVPLQEVEASIQGYFITSEPVNDIGEGAPIGYSRVVERFQNGSYIEHNYTTYEDYPDDIMTFMTGYVNAKLAHMSSNAFQRGLETRTRYYDANGILTKDVTNDYTVLPTSLTNVQCLDLKSTVEITANGGGGSFFNYPLTSMYYVHSCFLYQSTSSETTFDLNGQHPITTTVTKYYDNTKHLQPTRVVTIGSDGSQITTTTSFPDDYAAGNPFIDYLQENHFLALPIEQVVYKQNGTLKNIKNGNIITYKTTGAGLIDNLQKLETSSPILQTNFKFSNRLIGELPSSSAPAQFSPDSHYKPVLTYTQYDSRGNPLETIAQSGIKTAYLWGYNGEYPVAQVIGTDYTTALSKIDNPTILENPSDAGILRSELNKLRTISNTFVTTFTFAPLTGITSETTPDGIITYYEYDPFNRLMLVRDQDNNILKKYCYNYAGQPERCSSYLNEAINADYYSQNCPYGQGPVAYHISVPQGMFQSSVDQQTANQLAQLYAQKQANQNGACQVLNVSVYGENNHGTDITLQFYNVTSGQNYFFTVYAHDGGTLGELPPGTYDITLTPNSPTGWYGYSVGCGYWADGPGTMTFYGVEMTLSCNSIWID